MIRSKWGTRSGKESVRMTDEARYGNWQCIASSLPVIVLTVLLQLIIIFADSGHMGITCKLAFEAAGYYSIFKSINMNKISINIVCI